MRPYAVLSSCLLPMTAAMGMTAGPPRPQVSGDCGVDLESENGKIHVTCTQKTCTGKCDTVVVTPGPKGAVAYGCPCH